MTEKHKRGLDGQLQDDVSSYPITMQDRALYQQAQDALGRLPAPLLHLKNNLHAWSKSPMPMARRTTSTMIRMELCMNIFRKGRFRRACFAACLFALSLSGCQAATSPSDTSHESSGLDDKTAVLRFTAHSFSASCYDTIDCKVLYNNGYAVRPDDEEVSPPLRADRLSYLNESMGDIQNFPPPAIVTWRSKDGVPHEAKVDIGEIFKDQRILHHVPAKDIRKDVYIMPPGILLVVNDRTISVYMRADIPVKEPSMPGNRFSYSDGGSILAYSHTY